MDLAAAADKVVSATILLLAGLPADVYEWWKKVTTGQDAMTGKFITHAIALLAGQQDGTVPPSMVSGYYNQIPAATGKIYLELTGAGHGFPTSNNSVATRKWIPWMKIFLDNDTHDDLLLINKETGAVTAILNPKTAEKK